MERARTRSQASEPETTAAPSDAPEVLPRQAAAEVPTHGSVLPVFDPGLAARSDTRPSYPVYFYGGIA